MNKSRLMNQVEVFTLVIIVDNDTGVGVIDGTGSSSGRDNSRDSK